MQKVIILGSGPSGCTAAIYLGRAGLEPLVLEGIQPGGQLTITSDVDNFPGFPDGIGGQELMAAMKQQAEKFGTSFVMDSVEEVDFSGKPLKVRTSAGWLEAGAVIIATGAAARWIGVENEKKLVGRGVSACATCDGAFFRNKEVAIVGGGDSALTEAVFLTRFASKVTLIHRRDGFRGAKINHEKAQENPKIEFLLDSVVTKLLGDKRLLGVEVKNLKTGETSEKKFDGLFVAIGHDPNTKFLKGHVDLDEAGHVKTFKGTRTSVEGVFAAGDVTDPSYRQAISSAGLGCMAALDAEKYLESIGI